MRVCSYGSAPLASEDAHKLVADALVLPKHEAHLATAHADVSGWHICVGACIGQPGGPVRAVGLKDREAHVWPSGELVLPRAPSYCLAVHAAVLEA